MSWEGEMGKLLSRLWMYFERLLQICDAEMQQKQFLAKERI